MSPADMGLVALPDQFLGENIALLFRASAQAKKYSKWEQVRIGFGEPIQLFFGMQVQNTLW
jgi:hypothetical protein